MALGFLASDEQTHHHEVLIFTPADLSNLHALDNSYKTVGSLTMNDLSNAYRGNIDEHRENLYNMKLELDIVENGVMFPLIAMKRVDDPTTVLVEGHHRALIAIKHNLNVEVAVHYCGCPISNLDFLQLCPNVDSACQELKTKTINSEWEYHGGV